MNAISQTPFYDFGTQAEGDRVLPGGLIMHQTYWGYVMKADPRMPGQVPLLAWRWVSIVLWAISAGLWITPAGMGDPTLLMMKLGLSLSLAGGAWTFGLWSMGNGGTEVQVDLSMDELRMVQRLQNGRAGLVSRFKFKRVSSIHIDRNRRDDGHARLVMRLYDKVQPVEIACGPIEAMESLRDRIGRDVLVETRKPATLAYAYNA